MKKYETLQLGRERALRGQHADDRACTGDRYRRARHTPVHAFARERRRFHTPTLARRSPAAQWKVNGRLVGAGHGGESCHATARRRASGEDQLVQVSSRLILRLSRLKFALWGREVGGLRLPGGQGAGARCDVDRWFPAARMLASGEDRLVPTSSRLILRLSRLKFALSGREVGGLRLPGGQWAGRGAQEATAGDC